VEALNKDPESLVRAVEVWTGWGECNAPNRSDARVEAAFGLEAAKALLPTIKFLEQEFYRSKAHLVAEDLPQMKDLASRDFRANYPELSERIANALAWCYTYDFK